MKRLPGVALLLVLGIAIPKPVCAAPSIAGSVSRTPAGTTVMRASTTGDTLAAWCVIGRQVCPLDPDRGGWSAEFWVIDEAPGAAITFVAVDRDGVFAAASGGIY